MLFTYRPTNPCKLHTRSVAFYYDADIQYCFQPIVKEVAEKEKY